MKHAHPREKRVNNEKGDQECRTKWWCIEKPHFYGAILVTFVINVADKIWQALAWVFEWAWSHVHVVVTWKQ